LEKAVAVAHNWPICNAVPQLHAGGAASMAAYKHFKEPVVVERVAADAAIDIGDTLIGMHLKPVAVRFVWPLKPSVKLMLRLAVCALNISAAHEPFTMKH